MALHQTKSHLYNKGSNGVKKQLTEKVGELCQSFTGEEMSIQIIN